jgi:hypothetical protein
MVRQIIFAGFVVILPAGVHAQGRGGMATGAHSFTAAPRVGVGVQAPRTGSAQAMSGTRTVSRGGVARARTAIPATRSTRPQVTTRRRNDNDAIGHRSGCSSAPGFGFDEVHLAATCGSGTGGLRRGGLPFFSPFFGSGFYVPDSSAGVDEGSAADTPQPEVTDADVRERSRRYRVAEAVTEPAVEVSSATPTDNDEFVFVRRDGTLFFAVAYAWENGTLRYITSHGLRQIVTQDALDLDATRQFNEQRGLNFRSPA